MNDIILTGVAGSSGQAKGKVRVVHGAEDTPKFQKDEILVAVKTDPTMVMMMAKAAAIVTDTGGITAHAAITSREMGIPCVVATKTATTDLEDGQEVVVDGDKGEVRLIS